MNGENGFPTGTVAFLFSDIEGSTRRWDSEREAMRDALRRHDAILRDEIERRRGYVFKTIGDAFCAAFSSVGEALDSAVEIQRRLDREDFSAVAGILVRVSIHAGDADERSGDYFGPSVNRTARLLSAGHGGQILLSGLAADMAMATLPPGVTLRHLGTLALRDLKEPERVFQAIAPGLRSNFKPLRALETPPNNLPRQATSFVGREDDVARAEALLDAGPVVTIVGAGGIGKTRFALEVAMSRLNDERDGAWFVDLSAITNAALVPGAIVAALGAQASPGREPAEDLFDHLGRRQLLLVLDNCEHLLSGVAAVVAGVVARCPHVEVLATSREPLDVSGERVYRLSTLDLVAASRLFADRARAADTNFDDVAGARSIEAICARLDGIALAIELAAARVRTMSLADLSRRLELPMLAGGRDRRPRQQTMRALIDWSYDLLADEERRCLRCCSVFAGDFSLDVANSVCDDGSGKWAVLELLSSLVDKSLIVLESAEPGRRYRLLEPIREYAAEKLRASGESDELALRHARAFGEVTAASYAEWDLGPRPDWLARAERDLPNLRAALRWSVEEGNDRDLGARLAADSAPSFLRLALLDEGCAWCERVLSDESAMRIDVQARLRYGLSMLYSNLAANKKVLEQALLATALFREAGDARGLTRALSQVAARCALQARYDEAGAAAGEALLLARDSGDRRLLADTLRRCAQAFGGEGQDAVRERFDQSVALFRALGRDDETARALGWWSQWEAEVGDFRAAAELMHEAIRLDSRDAATMFTASDAAGYWLAAGEFDRAHAAARQSLAAAVKGRHRVLTALSITYLAVIEGRRNPSRAARLMGYAGEELRAVEWQLVPYERELVDRLFERLYGTIEKSQVTRLLEEGAAWSEEQAVAQASEVS
ncbi:MAG: adenylate/guanylate cyclase domain-containing protein [Candidatus Eremiobacteraeota bacterium]|nr:adenylate/guanylate cyclase domain-containing protein [Candidatus Eremiobacteraeota bacterium]